MPGNGEKLCGVVHIIPSVETVLWVCMSVIIVMAQGRSHFLPRDGNGIFVLLQATFLLPDRVS